MKILLIYAEIYIMSVNYSPKQLFLTLFCGLVCSAGMVFLVNFFLAGPKLGFHYDFLLSHKTPPPVSREILMIKTGDFIETSDIFSVLLTLTEMNASNLILTGRSSPSSSPVTVTEAEIRRRFVDEYIILATNIRNLFEAIRSGSISPVQAPVYVERLVELTEQGRDRLLTALIDKDENLLRAVTVFENFIEAETIPEYDNDGKLRRVKPVDTETSLEHPVFLTLKQRYAVSQIEGSDQELVLWLRRRDGKEIDIPLDKNGNIITAFSDSFRSVNLELFKEYDEAGRVMRNAIVYANELGAFSKTLPENSPLILGDYALMLREEMLKVPESRRKEAWITARKNYFDSLDEFLEGQAEAVLVRGYNEVITDEKGLNEQGLASLARMRDELSQSFVLMREEYDRLSFLRNKLKEELVSSFCIMGPAHYADYSALLANVMITNSHITAANDSSVLFWSISSVSLVLLAVFMLRPVVQLICGICLSVIATAAFSCVFIFYSYWIDPFIVLSSSLLGTFVIFYIKCAILKYRMRRFRAAYGTAVSAAILKKLIILGRPNLPEVVVTTAAVVAVKDIDLLQNEDNEKPEDAGKYKKMFFLSVKKTAFSYGAVVAGFEGNMVLVCFGTPLDKTFDPVKKACSFIKELLSDENKSLRFGVDFGKSAFYWTAETGYSVNGQPAVRARMLASNAVQLKARALVTESVRENLKASYKKIGSLHETGEPVFEFPR